MASTTGSGLVQPLQLYKSQLVFYEYITILCPLYCVLKYICPCKIKIGWRGCKCFHCNPSSVSFLISFVCFFFFISLIFSLFLCHLDPIHSFPASLYFTFQMELRCNVTFQLELRCIVTFQLELRGLMELCLSLELSRGVYI